tara:strand:+ start:463 stop:1572 length:1110 start_codon:yes stop_codon:yes gene_type:complete
MREILVISNTAFSVKKFRMHYLEKLAKTFSISICTPDRYKLNKKRKNFKFYNFGYRNVINEFFYFRKIIKQNNFKLIIVYSFKYQILLSICNFFSKNNILNIIAGKGSIFLIKNFLLKYLMLHILKIVLNKKNFLCFINPHDKKFFEKKFKLNPSKTFLIPTEGTKIDKKLLKRKNHKKNFIFFGRLIKQKGIEDYLNASKIVNRKYPNTNFFVAGPSSKKILGQSTNLIMFHENYSKKIKNEFKFINFLGYKNDYKSIYAKMDCLISPSFSEGAGNSIIEAMISKLFVICYKNNGHRYILKNTKNLICKKNNVKTLIKNIEKYLMLNNREINKRVDKSYLIAKKQFNTFNTYNALINIINKIISRTKK